MMLEALAAGLVAVALLYLVLQPLVVPGAVVAAPWEPPEAEETTRGRALLALKEIEFDRATGKLSDEDYHALQERYERAAIANLAGCQRCGHALADADRFCGACGARR
ncbi:MAG: zinc ribbon domain-containing protein [Gemmatimonadota bacterium]